MGESLPGEVRSRSIAEVTWLLDNNNNNRSADSKSVVSFIVRD